MDDATKGYMRSADNLLCQLHTMLLIGAPRHIITNQIMAIECMLVKIVDLHGNPEQTEAR